MKLPVKTLLASAFIGIFIILPSYAEDIYKRVDEQGVPSFSDAKTEGAEIIKVDPVNVQSVPTAAPPSYKATSKETSFNYNKLAIISPVDQTTLRNEHIILVQAAVSPGLRNGHLIEFLDNGQSLQAAGKSTSIELVDFERGSHSLSVRIVDKQGKVLKTSSPVTLYVFRTAIKPAATPPPPPPPPVP